MNSNSSNQTTLEAAEEKISGTDSKMGADPQTLPDDPVGQSQHGSLNSSSPVQKGLTASEIIESQQSDNEDKTKGDEQEYGAVPSVMDQDKSSPDLSRTR